MFVKILSLLSQYCPHEHMFQGMRRVCKRGETIWAKSHSCKPHLLPSTNPLPQNTEPWAGFTKWWAMLPETSGSWSWTQQIQCPMVTHLQLKKQPNLTQLFPHKNNNKCKLLFFSHKINKLVRSYWQTLLFNASGKCSHRGDLDIFVKVCGLCTGYGISTSVMWNSEAPPCDETSGNSLGVRKKSMKQQQKWGKSFLSPDWQLTFANKKVKTHLQNL